MKKKLLSLFLVICIMFSFGIPTIYAVTNSATPYISKDSVSVVVGGRTSVSFSYGTSATAVNVVPSTLCAEGSVSGSTLNIVGVQEGTCYLTLNFNDGTKSTIRVDVGNVSKGSNSDSDYDIEIRKGNYKNIYIDLKEFDATRATISYNSSYVTVNKTTFTASGYLKVTGKSLGGSTLKVKYNSGDTETYYIDVVSSSSNYYNNDEEIYLDDVDDTASYYIDLDDYDANSARITYDDDYIEVNKTYFSNSGTLKIIGIEEGTSEIKIKYDSGDTVYLTVYCGEDYDSSNRDEEDFIVSLNGTASYYIDLDDYWADKASVTYNSTYVSVSKTSFTSNGTLKITAKKKGTSVVKVKYDSGDTVYLNIKCGNYSNKDPYVSKEDISLRKGGTATFYVYLESSDKATLSVDDTKIVSVSKSSLTTDSSITVTGKKIGNTRIKVKFDNGSSEYVYVEVTDSSGTSVLGLNATLEDEKIELDKSTVLKIETNKSNSIAYVTIDNPSALKLDVPEYSKYTKTYQINIGSNISKELAIIGLECGVYNIEVRFGSVNSETVYPLRIEVLDNVQEMCEGVDSNGRQYRLNKGISIASNALNNGYINGYTDGTFGPDLNITREEFGVMLSRILNTKDKIKDSDYHIDVISDWSKEGIAELVSMGIVYSGGQYRPTDKITREEVAEMLYNALDLSNFGESCTLIDVYNTSIGKKIAKCCNAGLISGYPDGTFRGQNYITRAEVVTMLNRVFYKDNMTSNVNYFTDVPETHWAYSSILRAANR